MKLFGMKVKDLRKALDRKDDDMEIFIENSINPIGNISELCEARDDTYGFFGKDIPCIILGSAANTEFEDGE